MAALVLVKDASKDGGGVEVRNAIGLDLRERVNENQKGIRAIGGVLGTHRSRLS